MNERRIQVIKLAYQKLDKNNDGLVTLDDLKKIYNVRCHPDVNLSTIKLMNVCFSLV